MATADVTHVNLNDGVIEGLGCRDVRAFSVQYHPEAGPGPHDARYLFDDFRRLMTGERLMPKRTDIQSILLIGSGPIVIGQACEFDYSGTQACRVLKEEGYRVILVNSNPATIMTDPDFAHRTYVEPLDWETVAAVVERERPDAILPTLGGQTGLNLAMALHERGVLDEFGVELIGASAEAIRTAENRERVQGGHDRDRPGRAPVRLRLRHPRGGQGGRRDRLPGDRAPVVHPRRAGHRHRRTTPRSSPPWPRSASPPAPSPRS